MHRRKEGDLLGALVLVASPEDTLISKLEWARQGGGSELQLRDAAGILQLKGNELDLEYIERSVGEFQLHDLWRRVQAEVSGAALRRSSLALAQVARRQQHRDREGQDRRAEEEVLERQERAGQLAGGEGPRDDRDE